MPKDRKTLIADTAIDLLGELGARGLTHRAVDAQAGLPAGSTSFYCRSRLDLLTLALQRHAALDLADLETDAQRMMKDRVSREGLIDLLGERVADWLSPPKRLRLVARFELFMMASREPELAKIVGQQRQFFLHATEAALTQAGVIDPPGTAPALLALVDGLLLDQVGTSAPVLSPATQKAAFKRLLGERVKTGA
ncbi:TetR/AcrR family transcriptional regulator [Aquabacterium sp.]|uniref:TetR/AcrR family transcriptional regulator n=1 Tax=Aquabacterium sp. TaxID=1872578 RepID=UPI003D6CC42D